MNHTVALRSGTDRLRYSFTFEVSLLALLVPVGAVLFDKPVTEIGALGLALCLKALFVSLLYNWVFDRFDAARGRASSDRSVVGRVFHALGFELTLLTTSLPIYVWWLGLTFLEALTTDIVITSFVVVYTYIFTLGYDRIFPVKPRQTLESAPI